MKKLTISDTVPVLIDSIKDQEGFRMARCMYFSIECDTPSTGWRLERESGSIPFLMLGLSGIITRPVKGDRFTSVKDIESLFESIEKHEGLYIDINDIWFPLSALQRDVKRSDVYRIPFELFSIAYGYSTGRISMTDYLKKVLEYQTARSGQPPEMMEGEELPEQWRFERESMESEVFSFWELHAIDERRKMKFHEAHESYALGRKPEERHE